MKTIYELKLHESLKLEGFEITRVAGGWIYRYWDYTKQDYYANSTFVPYNKEFKISKRQRGIERTILSGGGGIMRKRMKKINIKSSTIKSISYDIDDYILDVEFVREAVYRYENVPPDLICYMLFAESSGKYFNKHIAKNYSYEKIKD